NSLSPPSRVRFIADKIVHLPGYAEPPAGLSEFTPQYSTTEDKPDGPDSVLDSPANAQALDECRESQGAALAFYHSPIHWDALWHPHHQKSALPAFPICCLGSLSDQPMHQRQLVGTQLPHDLGRPHIGFYSRLNILYAS
ncbi:hypothetical protein Ciccas_009046, partial [Cichlidogyrus casuarinus]